MLLSVVKNVNSDLCAFIRRFVSRMSVRCVYLRYVVCKVREKAAWWLRITLSHAAKVVGMFVLI